jgi:hypothetical protein
LLDCLLITNLKLKDLNSLENLKEKEAIHQEEEYQKDQGNQLKLRKQEFTLLL